MNNFIKSPDQPDSHFKLTYIPNADEIGLPLNISTIGITKSEVKVFWSPCDKAFLVYSISGCGRAYIDGRWQLFPAGTMVYFPPNYEVRYEPVDTTPWSTAYITFNGKSAISMVGSDARIISSSRLSFFPKAILEIKQLHKDDNGSAMAHSALYFTLLVVRELILQANEKALPLAQNNDSVAKVQKSIKAIVEFFTEDISISKLAADCGISEQYYCRLFKSFTGTNPTAYINSLRINKACDLLKKYQTEKVEFIAGKCGFRNIAYFNKIFKREIGVTPTRYRHMQQK